MAVYTPAGGKCMVGVRAKPRFGATEAATGSASAIVRFEAQIGRSSSGVDIDHRYVSNSLTVGPSGLQGGGSALLGTIAAGRYPLVAFAERTPYIWHNAGNGTTRDADIRSQAADWRAFTGGAPIMVTAWHEPYNYCRTADGVTLGPPGSTGRDAPSRAAYKRAVTKFAYIWHDEYPEAMVFPCFQGINFNGAAGTERDINLWWPGDTIPAGIPGIPSGSTGDPIVDGIACDAYQTTSGTPSRVPTADGLYENFYKWATGTSPTGGATITTVKSGRHNYPLMLAEMGCADYRSTNPSFYPGDKAEWFTDFGDWYECTGRYSGSGHPWLMMVVYYNSAGPASEGVKLWWIDGGDGTNTVTRDAWKAVMQRSVFNTGAIIVGGGGGAGSDPPGSTGPFTDPPIGGGSYGRNIDGYSGPSDPGESNTLTDPTGELVRWRFDDLTDNSFYVFAINPNAGGSMDLKRNTTARPTTAADGRPIVFQGEQDLRSGEFSGVLHSLDQIEALANWFKKLHPVRLTDDLGRRNYVHLLEIQFKREPHRKQPERHTYTARYEVMRIVNP